MKKMKMLRKNEKNERKDAIDSLQRSLPDKNRFDMIASKYLYAKPLHISSKHMF